MHIFEIIIITLDLPTAAFLSPVLKVNGYIFRGSYSAVAYLSPFTIGLTLLHPERPKLHTVLALLSATGLNVLRKELPPLRPKSFL